MTNVETFTHPIDPPVAIGKISPWTDERMSILKTLFDQGVPSGKIAEAINEQTGANFSENAIVGKADRMKLDRDKVRCTHAEKTFWQPEKDALLREVFAEGLSYKHMAKRIGCTRSAVGGRLKRLGLTTPATPLSAEEVRQRNSQRRDRDNQQRREKRATTPRLRIVRSNQSDGLRLIVTHEPAEVTAMRCAEILPRNLTLLDLEPNDCRFPYGEESITFCGHLKREGSSYCDAHFMLTRKDSRPRSGQPAKMPTNLADGRHSRAVFA